MSYTFWILLLCGASTFGLRWLPLWQARRRGHSARASRKVQRWLAGVGPAAIAALFVVSTWGLLVSDVRWGRVAVISVALLAICLARLVRGGIAMPTLAGALTYGLLAHFKPW